MNPPFFRPISSHASPSEWRAHRERLREDARHTLSPDVERPPACIQAWVGQLEVVRNLFSRRELTAWLAIFRRQHNLSMDVLHGLSQNLRTAYEQRCLRTAHQAYSLATHDAQKQGPWTLWHRYGGLEESKVLIDCCDQLDALAATSKVLKHNERTLMLQTSLNGLEVVVKRHAPPSWKYQLREGLRGSRGRKAWQAAHALEAVGIPTPTPIAALEHRRGARVSASYFVYEAIPNARSARSWIKPWLHQQPASTRHQVTRHLHAMLDALYASGLYHPDTKTGNLLVTQAENDAQRAFYWIDLDGLRPNYRPGRYGVLRNLTQLNGSLGRKIPYAERVQFLTLLSTRYPWLNQSWVPRYIERITEKRLGRELRRECGH